MKRFTLCYLLALAILSPQEAKDDGSLCSTKGGMARGVIVHECHCRLVCNDDGTFGEEGGDETSPTRCKKWCVKKACGCHPEPTPKDCEASRRQP